MRGMRSRSRPQRKGKKNNRSNMRQEEECLREREKGRFKPRHVGARLARFRTHGLSNYSSIVISHDTSKTSIIASPLLTPFFPSV
jgi:hypothetical protein